MEAEIITIGDEILIGQIVDTNSAWLGQEFNKIGVSVKQITSVSDNQAAILEALSLAEKRAKLVLITGGLGPTKDDVTKHALCRYFNTQLVLNREVLAHVASFFEKRNRPMLEVNTKQAEVLSGCEVLFNHQGTAPGMWYQKNETVFISLPGVPYEMKGIMNDYGFKKIKQTFSLPCIYHRTVLTQGIGESFLAEKIQEWENNIASKNISLAYLPSLSGVKLRLSAKGTKEEELKACVDKEVDALYLIIENYIYGEEKIGETLPTLQSIVGEKLQKQNKTLALAESCTGGYLSHLITSIPGSSAYYKGGIVAYDNAIKTAELLVSPATIQTHGAVSAACAEEMAQGVLKKMQADIALATTGIAGPTGATANKPVGTVYIALATKQKVQAQLFTFANTRLHNIQMASDAALSMLNQAL